jgi:REP element-mobilizing transposase RayT
MADTFHQIHLQIIFAVKGRANLLQKAWRQDVFRYMADIIKGKEQKPIIVNGVSDHVHLFVGLKPSIKICDLVRDTMMRNIYFNGLNDFRNPFTRQSGFYSCSYLTMLQS